MYTKHIVPIDWQSRFQTPAPDIICFFARTVQYQVPTHGTRLQPISTHHVLVPKHYNTIHTIMIWQYLKPCLQWYMYHKHLCFISISTPFMLHLQNWSKNHNGPLPIHGTHHLPTHASNTFFSFDLRDRVGKRFRPLQTGLAHKLNWTFIPYWHLTSMVQVCTAELCCTAWEGYLLRCITLHIILHELCLAKTWTS